MEKFDFIPYMLDCATRLKAIRHTEENPRFFRVSGLAGLEEYLQRLSEAQYPCLLVHDNQDGNVGDTSTSDNFLDNPYYAFYVVTRPEFGNADESETAKKLCKSIGFKILARMKRDKRNQVNGLAFLRFSSIPYQTIGPIGDQAVGVMFSFTVTDQASLVYNDADWDPVV